MKTTMTKLQRENLEKISYLRAITETISLMEKVKEDNEKTVCENCGGIGYVTTWRVTPGCCRHPLKSGECCGNPVPEQIEDQEQCFMCRVTGFIPTP
jgi:hypothetical protein